MLFPQNCAVYDEKTSKSTYTRKWERRREGVLSLDIVSEVEGEGILNLAKLNNHEADLPWAPWNWLIHYKFIVAILASSPCRRKSQAALMFSQPQSHFSVVAHGFVSIPIQPWNNPTDDFLFVSIFIAIVIQLSYQLIKQVADKR